MDKGKAIAIDTDSTDSTDSSDSSDSENSEGDIAKQGGRLDGSRGPGGSNGPRVREITLGAPRETTSNIMLRQDASAFTGRKVAAPLPNNNNLRGQPSDEQWVMRGGVFMREINLPPLARKAICDNAKKSKSGWVRVYFPHNFPQPNLNNFGEGTSRQGAAMFNGPTPMPMNFFAPMPTFDIYGRPIYQLTAPQVEMVNYYPTPYGNWFPLPNLYNIPRWGTNAQGAAAWHGGPPFISLLNPNAPKWCSAPEDDRSLYITFSHGNALTINQIFWFLAASFGIRNLLEVDINEPRRGPPHFGRLVFTASTIPNMILGGREEADIIIYGRTMKCKKWRPKRTRRHPRYRR